MHAEDLDVTPENYTGPPLNDMAVQICRTLAAEGFKVKSLPAANGRARLVIRITWREVYIGKLTPGLWSEGFGCLYRFSPMDGIDSFGFKEPANYSERKFYELHKLLASDCAINAGRYYQIRGAQATLKLMRQAAHAVDKMLGLAPEEGSDEGLADDLSELANSNISATERAALIKARLGQGRFRDLLGTEFGWTCPASGLNLPGALRASHIVAWREATMEERLQPLNGLLLSANVDALFDRHLLTFMPDGRVHFSLLISDADKKALGPVGGLPVERCKPRGPFLNRHNARFEELEQRRARILKESKRDA